MNLTLFKIVLFCHVASVVIGMGTAVFMHMQFISKKINWGELRKVFTFASKIIWFGLAGAIVTGIALWIILPNPRPDLFYGKVALVAMLVIDGIVIHYVGKPKLALLKLEQGFYDLPKEHKRAFYISGVFSFLGWWGALVIAYIL